MACWQGRISFYFMLPNHANVRSFKKDLSKRKKTLMFRECAIALADALQLINLAAKLLYLALSGYSNYSPGFRSNQRQPSDIGGDLKFLLEFYHMGIVVPSL